MTKNDRPETDDAPFRLPRFELRRVYMDQPEHPPEIVRVLELPGDIGLRRRELFSTAGVSLAAVLSVACRAEKDQKLPADGAAFAAPSVTPPADVHIASGSCDSTRAHRSVVACVAISPDGHKLASASRDTTVKVWQVPTGRLLATLKHPDWTTSVAFSHDSKYVASACDDGKVRLWGSNQTVHRTFVTGKVAATSVAFSPDGNWLAAGFEDGMVKRWSLRSGKAPATLAGHKNAVRSLSFSPDGSRLATADGSISVWNLSDHSIPDLVLEEFPTNASCVLFAPDGERLMAGRSDNSVKVWNGNDGKPVTSLLAHQGAVSAVAMSQDGKLIASASLDKTVRLWDGPSHELIGMFEGHGEAVLGVAISGDGHWLASSSMDGTVRLWDVAAAKLATCLFDPALMPEGREVSQVASADGVGILTTQPCGTPIPAGATCTCNCVSGSYKEPARPVVTSPMPHSYCSCNQVCTCIPVCHALRLADGNIVGALARQLLLAMGAAQTRYLRWARSVATTEETQRAIDSVIAAVHRGESPDPDSWPSPESLLARLFDDDEVVAIMCAQALTHNGSRHTTPSASSRTIQLRIGHLLRRASIRGRELLRDIAASTQAARFAS